MPTKNMTVADMRAAIKKLTAMRVQPCECKALGVPHYHGPSYPPTPAPRSATSYHHRPKSKKVERCSCEEALLYRKALLAVRKELNSLDEDIANGATSKIWEGVEYAVETIEKALKRKP